MTHPTEAGKEEKWNKIYSTKEWQKLKWELGAIFTKWIEVDGGGNIEGNPAIHRMAQYAYEYAQQREQQWVRVTDRLPTEDDSYDDYNEVLTIQIGRQRPTMMKYWEIKSCPFTTHWMKLPPAPPKQ